MKETIKVAFASGSAELNRRFIDRMAEIYPEFPLYVVAEFPPHRGKWVPYHVRHSFAENYARCRAAFRGKRIRLSSVLLVPRVPYRRMRLIALLLSPIGFLAFNENLDNFMLRPRSLPAIGRHFLWRVRNAIRAPFLPAGFAWRLRELARDSRQRRVSLLHGRARLCGALAAAARLIAARRERPPAAEPRLDDGVSVVIPSRNGRDLLEKLLPGLLRELNGLPSEVMVVDNGSTDGTAAWLRACHGQVQVEENPEPLSFARAVNRGIRRARYARVMLLNNDMTLEPGFFPPLLEAFDRVPALFCATAQIFFPPGARRQETGKAVLQRTEPAAFPIRYEPPLPGEDLSYVLYGGGGCSLYDTAKLRALGGFNEIYAPAYVEDLDAGYRAWLRDWPTVFVARAQVEHRHRATTSRYHSPEQLELILEINYLRFLAHSVIRAGVFGDLWRQAIRRLRLAALAGGDVALEALSRAPRLLAARPAAPAGRRCDERLVLALTSGSVAVFPGRAAGVRDRPTVLVACPYVPFPLSHGGAVRVFNLMRRASRDYSQVLVAFSDRLETPPAELLDICREVVVVRRVGRHSRPASRRPDEVEAFDSPAYRAALRATVRKWQPAIAQLEMTQMAQYASDCAPARTILVEHDITFHLYEQLAHQEGDWNARRELERWRRFETGAWRQVDRVVAMSEQDRAAVEGGLGVTIPNGVDLGRFQSSGQEPDPLRLLFIGSFAHLPNILAVEFFLARVWPLLDSTAATLHVIAGSRHDYYLQHHQRMRLDLDDPRIELEGFVADVRPAYQRAGIVIAPLVASAGTNIKILEALAMGKAIVSTPAGINGLDLSPGHDVLVTSGPEEMAAAILDLLENPARRRSLEEQARQSAREYDWDAIAGRQRALYEELAHGSCRLNRNGAETLGSEALGAG
ncbi:MAG: glycosyltransferase [Bryobacteraceae bacterium]